MININLINVGDPSVLIEKIIRQAFPVVENEASPKQLETDWLINFFEKSRVISEEEMQQLWVRLLAGEANQLGPFSRNTIDTLKGLSTKDAELFKTLCGFA